VLVAVAVQQQVLWEVLALVRLAAVTALHTLMVLVVVLLTQDRVAVALT
jgi:hypothetical protein